MGSIVDGLLGRFAYYCLYLPLKVVAYVFRLLSMLSYGLGFWFIRPWVKFVIVNNDGSIKNDEQA